MILPDRRISRARFLIPMPKREWMPSSQAIPLDDLGNKVIRTRFRLRARAHDGHIVWCGWFEDREDADAFLFALVCGSLRIERNLWRLPTPAWHPDLGEGLVYDFVTQTALTTTGSNQTYTSPSDWDNGNNSIECIGGGASGAFGSNGVHYTGGGGGSYSKITNFAFAVPGTTTSTYRVAASIVEAQATGANAGTNGEPTWWNSATNPGVGTDNSKCSAAGGSAGQTATGSVGGGAGGATTASWGQTKFAGGRGGNLTGASGLLASGGGGAAGPNGAGGNGVDSASTTNSTVTAGGQGGNGSGGAAGNNSAGGNGTDLDGSNGSGGGGGGRMITPGYAGGNYGGGGGGDRGSSITGGGQGGTGMQGIILVTYTPGVANPVFATNLAMMGL